MKLATIPVLPLFVLLLTAVLQAQPTERFHIAGGGTVVGHVVDSNAHSIVVRDTSGREMRIGRDVLRGSRFALAGAPIAAPPSENTLQITLTDGSTIVGIVRSSNAEGITVASPNGTSTRIPYSLIARQTPVTLDENGNVAQSDPNRTRLFFAPTGRPLDAGEGYFSISEVFFPMITVGLTDWLSIAAGISLVPGAGSQLLYLNVKATPASTPTAAFSVGTFYTLLPIMSGEGVVVPYGVGTFGSERAELTLGLGMVFSDYVNASPAVVAGFDVKLSESAMLLSENYFIPATEDGVFSLGVRFFGEHLAGDFGLFMPNDWNSELPFIPWLGLAYNF